MGKVIKLKKQQKGAAALFVAIIMLLGITLISLYAGSVGVQDQRISGNEYRAKEAFFTAEAGLEQSLSFLNNNQSLMDPTSSANWVPCAGVIAQTIPCGDGSVNKYGWAHDSVIATTTIDWLNSVTPLPSGAQFTAYLMLDDPVTRITALSIGGTVDGTGEAIVRVGGQIVEVVTTGPIPPIAAADTKISGNMTVVANPNNEIGNGVPVSVWSEHEFNNLAGSGGSFQTCHNGEYRTDDTQVVCNSLSDDVSGGAWNKCNCQKNLSEEGALSYDIVAPDDDFPVSMFKYLFNKFEPEQIQGFARANGLEIVGNCTDAELQAKEAIVNAGDVLGIIWVTGDCSIGLETLGSRTNPVVLVVEEKVALNGGGPNGTHIWGIIFSLYDGPTPPAAIKTVGSITVHGALLAEKALEIGGGTYNQVYDQAVFDNLTSSDKNSELAKCLGCWFDDL